MKSYHMRRREKEMGDEREMREILSAGRFAAVALCSGGEPYVVTMNHGWDADSGVLWFHCAREGKKTDIIRENGRACATIVEDLGYKHGECDHAYRSVVVSGTIEVVEDLDLKKRGLQILLEHQEKEPGPIKSRTLPDDEAYERVGVLMMRVERITGKQGL